MIPFINEKIQTQIDCTFCVGKGYTIVYPDQVDQNYCRECHPESEDMCLECPAYDPITEDCVHCGGTGKELITIVEYLKRLHNGQIT